MGPLLIVRRDEARQQILEARAKNKKIGLVPTMGALHQGHLSLVRAASYDCDFTVVTIFVNPTQFGPGEDYDAYPRDLDRDIALLDDFAVDMVFAPSSNEIYRAEHSTSIEPPRVAALWEGACRPGHFRGVATVVLKLLHIIPADVAFFGQKDFQQVRVIQDLVADLDLPVSIQACPIVREEDGLAMSSRNAYLSADERRQAVGLSESLAQAVKMSRDGETSAPRIIQSITATLGHAGIERIDYVAIVDPQSLQPVEVAVPGSVVLLAAYIGRTRLIDNARLG